MMERYAWIIHCSARLHGQWPTIAREIRDEVAGELSGKVRWRSCEPEQAAVDWIALGMPGKSEGDGR